MRGLDNYITGGRYQSHGGVPHVCRNGHVWTIEMFSEYGGSFYKDEEDTVCSKCDETGCVFEDLDIMKKALEENCKSLKTYRKILKKIDTKSILKEIKSINKLIVAKTQDNINGLPLEQALEELHEESIIRDMAGDS